MIAYRLDRSLRVEREPPAQAAARARASSPRRPAVRDSSTAAIESPVGIAAGPLPNSRWIEAYARLGYGLFTYKTVRTRRARRPASAQSDLLPARRVTRGRRAGPAPRRPGGGDLGGVVRPAVRRPRRLARRCGGRASRLGPASDPHRERRRHAGPGGRRRSSSPRTTRAARAGPPRPAPTWSRSHLACPSTVGEQPQMVFENASTLSATSSTEVRRAVGERPVVAKLGATREPARAPRPGHRAGARARRLHRSSAGSSGAVVKRGRRRRRFAGAGRETVGHRRRRRIYDALPRPGGRAARVAQGGRLEPRHPRRRAASPRSSACAHALASGRRCRDGGHRGAHRPAHRRARPEPPSEPRRAGRGTLGADALARSCCRSSGPSTWGWTSATSSTRWDTRSARSRTAATIPSTRTAAPRPRTSAGSCGGSSARASTGGRPSSS